MDGENSLAKQIFKKYFPKQSGAESNCWVADGLTGADTYWRGFTSSPFLYFSIFTIPGTAVTQEPLTRAEDPNINYQTLVMTLYMFGRKYNDPKVSQYHQTHNMHLCSTHFLNNASPPSCWMRFMGVQSPACHCLMRRKQTNQRPDNEWSMETGSREQARPTFPLNTRKYQT